MMILRRVFGGLFCCVLEKKKWKEKELKKMKS